MARTVPVYAFQAADGSTIRFAVDSDFWITNLTGEDGLDVEMTEQQSTGQTGKTITGQSIGSRSLTVTGSILRDLDANEALLKRLVRPKEAGRFLKTVGDTTWYLEVLPSHTPDVSGGEHLLNFQFKLKAAYPYWRTVETAATMLGGLEGSWFPTPVSTAGSWYISKYKKDVYTTVVNSGSTETEFVLTLTASARVKNPMLWHNGKRSYLKLNKEMLPGESAIISTVDGSRGCTYRQSDGTEVNGFRWLDYDSDLWMTLDPGDNVLRLTADEGRENLTATVTAPKGVAAGV